MSINVGGIERVIRILLGLALLSAGLLHYVTGTWAIVAYIIGAIALLTGLIAYCPAWTFFGINTSEHKSEGAGGPVK